MFCSLEMGTYEIYKLLRPSGPPQPPRHNSNNRTQKKLDNCDQINKKDKDKSYTVGPRIKTNGAKNGQNGTRCSVARKWALAQRTDQ